MAKNGTTMSRASDFVSKSKGAHHGPSNKHIVHGGHHVARPSGPVGPIKGSDKGGV